MQQPHNTVQVLAVEWNCTGDYLATGSGDKSLLVWKVEQHGVSHISSLRKSAPKQLAGIRSNFFIAWHPKDPARLVSFGLEDQAISFWDTRSGKVTSTVTAAANKKQKYLSAVWAPNGYEVVVTTVTNHNFLIDSRKSAVVKSVHAHVELNQAAISPDGTTMLQGIGTGEIQVYDFPSFQFRDGFARIVKTALKKCSNDTGKTLAPLRVLERLKLNTCLLMHRLFVTGSHDSTATVWDYETLMPIKSHVNADWTVNAVGFSHDSQYLALGGDENEIKISDTYTGGIVHTIPCHGTGYALSWHPQRMLLAYCGREEKADRGTGTGYVNVFAPSVS